MADRLNIRKGEQINFINQIKKISNLNCESLAKLCRVSGRSFRDWARGKYKMPIKSARSLSKRFNTALPKNYGILNEYWYIPKIAKMGAVARYKLYGPPGSIESRRKGGLISQQNREKNPEKYKSLGCIIKKDFINLEHSEKLAELVGIIMGDGSITNNQLRIYLDRKVDKNYSLFISNLIKEIFNECPSVITRKSRGTIEITLSGVMIIKSLEKIGLRRGNKIFNNISFPSWILKKKAYKTACIRGLFDTDGGLYLHVHKNWKNKKPYLGWCFSSSSKNILKNYYRSLLNIGIRGRLASENRIYIYNFPDIANYMKLVNTNNEKIRSIFDKYSNIYNNFSEIR